MVYEVIFANCDRVDFKYLIAKMKVPVQSGHIHHEIFLERTCPNADMDKNIIISPSPFGSA